MVLMDPGLNTRVGMMVIYQGFFSLPSHSLFPMWRGARSLKDQAVVKVCVCVCMCDPRPLPFSCGSLWPGQL